MNFDELKEQLLNPEDITDEFDESDITANKGVSIAACFPILFWIPIVASKESAYGKHYANQGFILLVMGIVFGIVGSILGLIPVVGAILSAILNLIDFAAFLFLLINAINSKAKYIPFVGKLITLFK
ncbi:MAG: hypothetical protein IJ236_09165 [Oscillospiraceae bacterium]|nr:hypothetical protein [Oscillospiraceae bacterium]MBQ9694943.1 hypothetical protein [Oscillospiraceae bacterium]MBR1457990.1 hypothetical protein [Oscillospiraceae bacterium]MBR1897687.1 hypothetical protein [Oscillospiraceae bacterium]